MYDFSKCLICYACACFRVFQGCLLFGISFVNLCMFGSFFTYFEMSDSSKFTRRYACACFSVFPSECEHGLSGCQARPGVTFWRPFAPDGMPVHVCAFPQTSWYQVVSTHPGYLSGYPRIRSFLSICLSIYPSIHLSVDPGSAARK